MKKKKHSPNILATVLAASFYAFMLIFIKYYSNGIEFGFGSLLQVGNIFDLTPFVLFLTATVIILTGKRKVSPALLAVVNIMLFLSIGGLIAALFLKNINIDFKIPLIYYPFRKVVLGGIYCAGYFLQLFSALYLIYYLLNEKYFAPLRAIYLSVLASVFLLLFALITVLNTSNHSEVLPKSKSDVAIILGAAVWNKEIPSPLFKARIEKGYELYRIGSVKKLQVTGGNAPGELSEAEVAKKYLIDIGVPEKDILLEENTSTTAEQIRFIKYLSVNEGLKRVTVISDSFHLRRIIEMSKFFDVSVNGISSNYKLNWRNSIYYYLREAVALSLFWLFAI